MFTCWRKDVYMRSNCVKDDMKQFQRAGETKKNPISW